MPGLPCAMTEGDITEGDVSILEFADKFLADLLRHVPEVSCHHAVKAWKMSDYSGLVARGRYAGHEHSWLVLHDDVILDLYPVAQVRPLLIDASTPLLRHLYQPEAVEERARRAVAVYHARCDAYDDEVCTGRQGGMSWPANSMQKRLSISHAAKMRSQVQDEFFITERDFVEANAERSRRAHGYRG